MSRRAVPPLVIALVILGIIATSVFIYYQIVRGVPDSVPPPPPPGPAAAAGEEEPAAAEARTDLPPLEESDDFLRPLVSQLSDHPELASWLVPDRLVERFVTAVDNVGRGESPRPHLRFLAPERGFRAAGDEDSLVIDPRSYARYDVVVEVFTSLDTAAGVGLYRELEPLFEEAYRELGYPAGEFDQALAKAIDLLLATPIPAGEVELERRATSYHLKDPRLEALSPAQKHFLRLGPANMRRVQAKLRLMRSALGLPRSE